VEPMGISNQDFPMHQQIKFIIKKQQHYHLQCDEKARNKQIYNIKYIPLPFPLNNNEKWFM
jgi:hypothetical protein